MSLVLTHHILVTILLRNSLLHTYSWRHIKDVFYNYPFYYLYNAPKIS